MARAKAKKTPAFELDVDTRFEMSGRGTVTWFMMLEEDDYGKIGGNFFPNDPSKIEAVVDDLLAETEAQLKEAGIDAVRMNPKKKDDDGNVYYKVNRKAVKKDGTEAVVKFRDISGKNEIELEDELGNGSVVAMKYYASPYYMPEKTEAGVTTPARFGVSLSPLIVQIIDHKIYEGDDGFGNEADDMVDDQADDAPFDNESDDDDY